MDYSATCPIDRPTYPIIILVSIMDRPTYMPLRWIGQLISINIATLNPSKLSSQITVVRYPYDMLGAASPSSIERLVPCHTPPVWQHEPFRGEMLQFCRILLRIGELSAVGRAYRMAVWLVSTEYTSVGMRKDIHMCRSVYVCIDKHR